MKRNTHGTWIVLLVMVLSTTRMAFADVQACDGLGTPSTVTRIEGDEAVRGVATTGSYPGGNLERKLNSSLSIICGGLLEGILGLWASMESEAKEEAARSCETKMAAESVAKMIACTVLCEENDPPCGSDFTIGVEACTTECSNAQVGPIAPICGIPNQITCKAKGKITSECNCSGSSATVFEVPHY